LNSMKVHWSRFPARDVPDFKLQKPTRARFDRMYILISRAGPDLEEKNHNHLFSTIKVI